MDARTQSAAQTGERAKIEHVVTRAHQAVQGTGEPLPRDGGRNDVAASRVGRKRRQDDSTWPHQETSSRSPPETKHRMMMSRDSIRPGHGAMSMSDGPAGDGARHRQRILDSEMPFWRTDTGSRRGCPRGQAGSRRGLPAMRSAAVDLQPCAGKAEAIRADRPPQSGVKAPFARTRIEGESAFR